MLKIFRYQKHLETLQIFPGKFFGTFGQKNFAEKFMVPQSRIKFWYQKLLEVTSSRSLTIYSVLLNLWSEKLATFFGDTLPGFTDVFTPDR